MSPVRGSEDLAFHRLVAGEGLSVVFQPIADLNPATVVGFEALSRFADGASPDTHFADAEALGRRGELELAAVREALSRIDQVPDGTYVSINVSPDVAVSPEFGRLLVGAPLGRMVIEITEHEKVRDYQELHDALAGVRASGTRIAIDDVGSGFASLTHVLRIRPDVIKLDVCLTRDIDDDAGKRALVGALVAFASSIDSVVVAEGIETVGELEALTDLGVRYGQGYLLGRPAVQATRQIASPERRTFRTKPGWGAGAHLAALVETAHSSAVYAPSPPRKLRRLTVTGLLLAVLILSPATVALAGNAQPGSAMWGVKTFVEDARLKMVGSSERRLALHLGFASDRQVELAYLASGDADPAAVAAATRRLNFHLKAIERLVARTDGHPGASLRAAASRGTKAARQAIAAACTGSCGKNGPAVGRGTSAGDRSEKAATTRPAKGQDQKRGGKPDASSGAKERPTTDRSRSKDGRDATGSERPKPNERGRSR